MRVKGHNYESRLKQALDVKSGLPADAEAALFAQAEALMSARRERISSSLVNARRRAQAGSQILQAMRVYSSRLVESLAIHPDAPAAATALAVLVLAFVALHGGSNRGLALRLTYADLPDFPKNNAVPARYDAQRLAEQQAYEREVEDAHRKTSGGI